MYIYIYILICTHKYLHTHIHTHTTFAWFIDGNLSWQCLSGHGHGNTFLVVWFQFLWASNQKYYSNITWKSCFHFRGLVEEKQTEEGHFNPYSREIIFNSVWENIKSTDVLQTGECVAILRNLIYPQKFR